MDPFAPDDVTWHPVSDRLATGRRLVVGVVCAVVAIAVVAAAVLSAVSWLLALVAVPVLALAWAWWLIGRQVRAIGYVERADDLLVRHGVMFRNIVVVPYGRMQFVDVAAGPLARKLGYSSVQLHTASPGTDASIDGLVPDEAARLRDRLAQRGEARLAGL
ncbi:PH domain-containing protein [Angustibacter sp. Root456]|uniref:PH domain-containing protein n=1 Tax=Angustibacter sp. Root456 TaxID=1736539 RepID=UPI00190FEAAA|nr:PH domain-containing protein [Angustibacter sp. Root456]